VISGIHIWRRGLIPFSIGEVSVGIQGTQVLGCIIQEWCTAERGALRAGQNDEWGFCCAVTIYYEYHAQRP